MFVQDERETGIDHTLSLGTAVEKHVNETSCLTLRDLVVDTT